MIPPVSRSTTRPVDAARPVAERSDAHEVSDVSSVDVAALKTENARLRAEVEQLRARPDTQGSHILFDLKQHEVTVQNLATAAIKIDRLHAHLDHADALMEQTVSTDALVATAAGASRRAGVAALDVLLQTQLTVKTARVRIPQAAANRLAQQIQGAALKREGIAIDNVEFQPRGGLRVSGTVHRFVDIPFTMSGHVACAPGNKIRMTLHDLRLGGFLRVPDLVTRVLSSLTKDTMRTAHVEVNGKEHSLDVASLLPPNVKANLTRVTTEDGHLLIEAGPPAMENNPKTLLMQ